MKKRSNITLLVILLLLLSIPVAGYCYFRHLVNEAEKSPLNKGLNEIRLNTDKNDSLQFSVEKDDNTGFQVKTSVVRHSNQIQGK